MLNFITRMRRNIVRDRVITNGKRIRELRAARAGINPDLWPHDAAAFEQMIEQRERRQQRYLAFLKNTA